MTKKSLDIAMVLSALFTLLAVSGCQSDRDYQARAADRAREYLLANAPELDSAQTSYVRYNDPILLTGDGLSGKVNGVKQICITWDIPGTGLLYMVFGTSRERMDNWYPNRLIKRNYVALSGAVNSAVKFCRKYAVTSYLDDISENDMNIVRFSDPEIITSKFALRPEKSVNDPNLMPENRLEEPLVKEKKNPKEKKAPQVQISLVWNISGDRCLVFCGTAANESLAGWKLNFANICDRHDVDMARKKLLKRSTDYNTPIPVPPKKKAVKKTGAKKSSEVKQSSVKSAKKVVKKNAAAPAVKKAGK